MKIQASENKRKLIHLFVGLLIYLLTFFTGKEALLWAIAAGGIFAFVTYNHARFRFLHYSKKASLGTLFYPLGILSAFLILFPSEIIFFRVTILILVVCDPLANLAGQIKTFNYRFRLLDEKSIFGILTYALSSFLVFLVFLPAAYNNNFSLLAVLVLFTVASEAISVKGSDNFSIPLVLALFFRHIDIALINFNLWLLIIIVFSAGSILLYKLKVLSRKASAAAWLLGLYLALVLGLSWLLSILLFFVTSVLLTRINTQSVISRFTGTPRNLWQLLANSLWALLSTVAFLLTHRDIFIYLYIVFVATVTADTWASEAGPLINKRAFSLNTMRMDNAGISGGISLGGTMAALAGATLVSLLSYYFFFEHINASHVILIILAAVAGTFADSLMGAFAEKKLEQMKFFNYDSTNEKLSPNDIVNLVGSLTAGITLLVLL